MAALTDLPVRHKAYTYILRKKNARHQLLVFDHVDFPEAGAQVPGGTVEPGEDFAMAAQREAFEETGLNGLVLECALCSVQRDMRGVGLEEVHHRHYYYLTCPVDVKESWIANEMSPSDGSEGPIALHFYWVDLNVLPALLGGLDEMLPLLRQVIEEGPQS